MKIIKTGSEVLSMRKTISNKFTITNSKKYNYMTKENKHDRLVGIAMSLIEGVFEVREDKAIDGEEYYELEDEIIKVLKANEVK